MKNKSIIVSLIVVICFIGLVIFAVSYKKPEVSSVDGTNNGQAQGSVEIQVLPQEGQSTSKSMEKISKNGDVLVMNYTGRFAIGTVFDSNIDPKFKHPEPFEFTLGAGQVIKGWDEGLLGMKVGEKKTLTVAPDKGYGPNDYGPIPGNSTLIFDVELVSIE